MKERAPLWIRESCDHFRRELFSAYTFPRFDVFLDDLSKKIEIGDKTVISGAGGMWRTPADRSQPRELILDRIFFTIEHLKSMSAICHELAHGALDVDEQHGPKWQALMMSVGLTPVRIGEGWNEEVVRDGLFWQSYYRLPDVQQAVKYLDNKESAWRRGEAPSRGRDPSNKAAAPQTQNGAPYMPDRSTPARRAPSAPAGSQATTVMPRDRPDFTVEVRDGAEAVQARALVNEHVAKLTDIVGNIAHQLSIVEDRMAIRDTRDQLLAGADKMAAQVLAQQQAQLTADQQNNAAGSAQLRAGLEQIGGQIKGAIEQIFTGVAQQHAAQIANARDTSAPVQIGSFNINPSVFAQAPAALPRSSRAAALSPPTSGYTQVGRAPQVAALPAQDTSRAVAVVQPRSAVPARRA